jgi:hypothetical protein
MSPFVRISPFFAIFAIFGRAASNAWANEKTAPKGGLIAPSISKADMPVNNLFC